MNFAFLVAASAKYAFIQNKTSNRKTHNGVMSFLDPTTSRALHPTRIDKIGIIETNPIIVATLKVFLHVQLGFFNIIAPPTRQPRAAPTTI